MHTIRFFSLMSARSGLFCNRSVGSFYNPSAMPRSPQSKWRAGRLINDTEKIVSNHDFAWQYACSVGVRGCVNIRMRPPRRGECTGVPIYRRDVMVRLAESACAYTCNRAIRVGCWRAREGWLIARMRRAAIRIPLL